MRGLLSFVTLSALLAQGALALTYKGADISSLAIVERNGVSYKDTNGATTKLETLLKTHGMNTARVRLWTAGDYTTAYGLALAKRIKAAGLTLIVDLHYSDTWADPGHQATPSGWGTTLAQLNTAIYNYTKDVVTQFAAQGTPIDILQIGNEINNGMMLPVGSTSNFDNLSQLLHSARQGARDAGFAGKAMIHLADGWSSSSQMNFYNNIFRAGEFTTADIDIMGVSFYPFYGTGATLNALKSSLTALVNKFGKDIMVAETDWPAISCNTALSEPSVAETPAGQLTWVGDITTVLNSLPNAHGKGILYWEPAWIGNAALGSSCGDNLIVDSSGKARTSIDIFTKM